MADSIPVVIASDQTSIESSYNHISSNTTTLVKSGTGKLHNITINTKGTLSNVATVYDNTTATGAIISVIDTTVTYGTLIYNCVFNTGLTVYTATGTAADITVTYE